MGGGSAPKPDTAITLSISRLAGLLGVKPALLKDILGTTAVELRDQPKIVAGGIDAEREMGFWTFFNKIGSIHTLPIPRELYMHNIRRECLNGAVNDGAHSILLEPAANSMVLLYVVSTVNLDTVGVDHIISVRTAGGAHVANFNRANVAAGASLAFPRSDADAGYIDACGHGASFIFIDSFELYLLTLTVAVAQETRFFILYSYIGDAPTITETGPAGSVFSDVP